VFATRIVIRTGSVAAVVLASTVVPTAVGASTAVPPRDSHAFAARHHLPALAELASTAKAKTTKVSGFRTTPVSMRLGGEVAATVTVTPRAARTVSLQYQRNGRGAFRTLSRSRTSKTGQLEVRIRPPAAGAWRVRLVVAPTARAAAFTSRARTVRVTGVAATTQLSGFDATPAALVIGSTLAPSVTAAPAGTRTVELQTKKPGAAAFVVAVRGKSTAAGAFTTIFTPSVVGVWQYRLVVRASPTAKAGTTAARPVTVSAVPAAAPPPAPPVASLLGEFGESPLSASVGFEIGFDAGRSGPGTGNPVLTAVLDFGDGSAAQPFSGDPLTWKAAHTYGAVGGATARLIVRNAAGGSAVAFLSVAVFPPPTLSLRAPATAVANTQVQIDFSFFPPPGTRMAGLLVVYSDGESLLAETWAGPFVHVFHNPGPAFVDLIMCDDANGCAFASVDIDITPDQTTAALSAVPSGGAVNSPIFFDVSKSRARSGTTLTSEVLTTSDGTTLTLTPTQIGVGANIAFTTPGQKTVTLTVTDSVQVVANATTTVTITAATARAGSRSSLN
jgi:hypothetical protein